jgi:pimeloyl-ACP methyl ester carboxylesterase
MALPGLVLVHGGAHAADCWDLTIGEIGSLAPELTVIAVDLPGRRAKPGDLWTLTIADWVTSVVADVEDAGLEDVVIVGHSMAGLTVPGVVTKLGAARVREMILAAACVPPDGKAMVDVIARPVAMIARRHARKGAPYEAGAIMARFMFLNSCSSTGFPVRAAVSWRADFIRSPRRSRSRRYPAGACPMGCRARGS